MNENCISGCQDIKIGCKVLIYKNDIWAYRVLDINQFNKIFEINHENLKLRYQKFLIHDQGCECRNND